jgi:long-chain fatty acid transport protein
MRTRWPAFLLIAISVEASAGGMSLPFRGVRATGRGGAFVAGADGTAALRYNPAGLAALAGGASGSELVVEGAAILHRVQYTRVDSGGNRLPPVSNDPHVLPIPAVAAEVDLGRDLALGLGVHSPYAGLDGYPEDGPQRYSLVSTRGTKLAVLEVALAWRANDWLSVGASLQNMMASLQSRVVFSACPAQTICAPEDPEFDSLAEIHSEALFTPSALFGVQAAVTRALRLGAAFQLPFFVHASGAVRIRLPPSGYYDGARVEGDRAEGALTFASMLKLGAELAPTPRFRVEAGFDWEMWSQHDKLDITPRGVRIVDVAGVGVYELGTFVIPRRLRDTYAVRVGLEAEPFSGTPLTVRAGWIHETGAARPEYLSVFTVDTAKNVATLGVGWRWRAARLDASYAHVFMDRGEVARGTSCAPILNPIRSGQGPAHAAPCVHDDDPDHVYVGDGTYRSSWDVFGLGLMVDF